ncbi:MAG TPA: ComF family protein [Novosphingobium sp.]|nr:ComF family protein [Novosphingobium sp.]
MTISKALSPVIDLIFPPRCPLCGAGLSAQTGLCGECWSGLAIPGEPACTLCNRPFGEGVAPGSVCAPCMASPPRHDGIAAATLYNDTSRKLVLMFKHGQRIALAPMMARLIAARMEPLDDQWLVVPVPLHRWRLWRRGFNQAAALAAGIVRQCGGRLAVDALVRRKATPSLGGLGARARNRAIAGAIAVNPAWTARISGANVVLVDDVMTSGATSDACVSSLKRAGVERVKIACFARVLDEAL